MHKDIEESAQRTGRYFDRIGQRIENEWLKEKFDPAALPAIAERTLRDDPAHLAVKAPDIANWYISHPDLPQQYNDNSRFGQPPVTMFAHRRFYIEVLHWFDATTAIHQHGFDGAFAVLSGSSIHSTYHFAETDRTSERLLFGDVTHQNSELLHPGSVRPIHSGNGFIHALFHLERPSLSIVIRTPQTRSAGIQYSYEPPYIALDPFDEDRWTARALDYLGVARAMKRSDAAALVQEAFERADDLGCQKFLLALHRAAEHESVLNRDKKAPDTVAATMAAAATIAVKKKLGILAAPILLAAQESLRSEELLQLRNKIHDPEHRYFLALLMNVPRRERVLELVKEMYPEHDPHEKIHTWLAALTDEKSHLSGYALGEDALTLADSMIRNQPLAEVVRSLEKKHDVQLELDDVEEVKASLAHLATINILRPLLVDVPNPSMGELLARASASRIATAR